MDRQAALAKAFPRGLGLGEGTGGGLGEAKPMAGDVIEKSLHQHMVGEFPFAPVYDRMLFLPDPPPSEMKHGGLTLYHPEEYREKTCRGVIVDAGLQARDTLRSHGMLIGDRIFIPRYTGVLFPWRGKQVVMMPVKDINMNFDLAERIDRGLMVYAYDTVKAQHFIEWRDTDAEIEWKQIMKDREATNEGESK